VKTLVFLLVLFNLLFYAFGAGYFGRSENPDAVRLDKQVLPERMKIVSRGEAPVAKAVEPVEPEAAAKEEVAPADEAAKAVGEVSAEAEPAAKAVPPSTICLAWEHLAVTDADKVSALLAAKFGEFKTTRRIVGGESNGWWVFIPPLAGKAEADKKAGELRQLEVTDYFIVQEGPNRFAISLGVFSSEKGGQERLAELKEKGVRTARLSPRPGKDGTVSLQASGPATAKAALLDAVAKAVPKAGGQACK
jgi:hypothetical protein